MARVNNGKIIEEGLWSWFLQLAVVALAYSVSIWVGSVFAIVIGLYSAIVLFVEFENVRYGGSRVKFISAFFVLAWDIFLTILFIGK